MSSVIVFVVVLVIGFVIVALKFSKQFTPAMIAVVGAAIFADTLWHMPDAKALRTRGEQALARPASETYTETTRMRSGRKSYKTTIAFQTSDGRTVTKETDIPPAVLDKFRRGEPVTVTYLPTKPAVFAFNPLPPLSTGDIWLGVVVMIGGAGWVAFKRRASAEAVA